MSVFDLFRGFFGVPGGQYRGQRDPFFDSMTHDDDDDDEDDEDGFTYDGYRGDQQDPFDRAFRFGFSFGPDGMRVQEPEVFGHVLREMEEIFTQLGRWDGEQESGFSGLPHLMQPPPQDKAEQGAGARSSGNPLRDFMLKSPNSIPQGPRGGPPAGPPSGPSREPNSDRHPFHPSPGMDGWTPFSKFNAWPQRDEERKEDRDLDSAVSSGVLDQILAPPAGQAPNQPRTRSFFQSVTISKVVKPDGTVEERRTVRDSQGKEETTVTRSGPEVPDHQPGPAIPGGHHPFSDMRDDNSLFSRLFGDSNKK